jgi:Clostripain family
MKPLSVFLLLALLVACPQPPNVTPTAKLTVLVYMVGSDLEDADLDSKGVDRGSQATTNIKEMLAAASSPDVNLVLETGGTDKAVPTDPVKSWKTVKRHIIKGGAITEIADVGAVAMSDPNTLRDFITWGETTYSAEKTALVLWDHGAGYAGFGLDVNETNRTGQKRLMTLPGFERALREAQQKTSHRINLMGFDACLMATAEVADLAAPYADYLVASEETEPGTGWDWKALMDFVAATPAAAPQDVGVKIADAYLEKQVKQKRNGITLSVVNLSRVEALSNALGALSATIPVKATRKNDLLEIAAARARSLQFDVSLQEVDIGDWMAQLQSSAVATQAAAVRTALQSAVVHEVHSKDLERSNGLSVYFPESWKRATTINPAYLAVPFVENFKVFIGAFFNWMGSQPSALDITNVNWDATSQSLTATANSTFGLFRAELIVSSTPSTGQSFAIDSRQIVLKDASVAPSTDLSVTVRGDRFTLEGKPIYAKGQPPSLAQPNRAFYNFRVLVNGKPAYAYFESDTSSGSEQLRLTGYQLEEIEFSDRVEDFEDNDELETLVPSLNRKTLTESETPSGTPFLAGAFALKRVPLSAGGYSVYLLGKDLTGLTVLTNPVVYTP